jgi:hypothetical protein
MNLKRAYNTAKKMDRSLLNLHLLNPKVVIDLKKNQAIATATVKSNNSRRKVTIAWSLDDTSDSEKSKLVDVKGSDNRKRLKALSSPYPVSVDCNCEDYIFTFYPYAKRNDSALKLYEVPPPKGTGKPRAVNAPGLCKHLLALATWLKSEGYVV